MKITIKFGSGKYQEIQRKISKIDETNTNYFEFIPFCADDEGMRISSCFIGITVDFYNRGVTI